MTHTDPIADLLIRIKNAYLARLTSLTVPYSKIKEEIAKVMQANGYLAEVAVAGEKSKKELAIKLLYKDGVPAITDVVRESSPGLRRYVKKDKLNKLLTGVGIVILTTPKGIKTAKEAKKQGVGGEIICKVW